MTGYQNLDVGNVTEKNVTGLTAWDHLLLSGDERITAT